MLSYHPRRPFRVLLARICASLFVGAALILGATSSLAAERPNHDDFDAALIAYHDDGTYDRELREVAARVIAHLRERAPKETKPALVLDIDETSLSNWPELQANQFAFFPSGPCDHLPDGPCGNDTWEKLGVDAPLEPILEVYRAARALHVAVFFITGRKETARHATEQNLRNVGYSDWERVIMEPEGSHFSSAADFKAPAREALEQKDGYRIIANVGDQASDITGGHPEHGFQLPNPFYRIP